MNKENEIKKLYDEYQERVERIKIEKDEYRNLKREKKQLESNQIVKKYIDVVERFNSMDDPFLKYNSEDIHFLLFLSNILRPTLKKYALLNLYEPINIFVFSENLRWKPEDLVCEESSRQKIHVDDFSTNFDFKRYFNIETTCDIDVKRDEVFDFERDNIILYAPSKYSSNEGYESFIVDVNLFYLDILVKEGQEEAINKVISKFGNEKGYCRKK